MSLSSVRALHVIAYHYVRDASRSLTPAAGLHAMPADDFRKQVSELQACYEMATLESASAFLRGQYEPRRDLCLLTFDDGLRDHFDEVFPALRARRIQGVFFLITSCLDGQLSAVHQSHFLMASLGLGEYQQRVLKALTELDHDLITVDPGTARATYRWDTEEAAQFKYLLNFVLTEDIKELILGNLFTEILGDPDEFARRLYLDWSEAAAMQADQMIAGGHTHSHRPLGRLSAAEQRLELSMCTTMLRQRLRRQAEWPFSFPYGKLDSFDEHTLQLLNEFGYDCAFTTVPGDNSPGADRFKLRRIDPKEATIETRRLSAAAQTSDAHASR
jgi:peptidoglycan/xylan/chitin deacetylase (PgdA/CDA1 family)